MAQHDEENMECVADKILRKIVKSKETLKKSDNSKAMMLDDALITPELFSAIDKRT